MGCNWDDEHSWNMLACPISLKAIHLISGIFGRTAIIMLLLVPVTEGIVIPWFATLLSIMAAARIQFMVHNSTTPKITEISKIINIKYRSWWLQRLVIAIQMS
jgi:hypothetical protein